MKLRAQSKRTTIQVRRSIPFFGHNSCAPQLEPPNKISLSWAIQGGAYKMSRGSNFVIFISIFSDSYSPWSSGSCSSIHSTWCSNTSSEDPIVLTGTQILSMEKLDEFKGSCSSKTCKEHILEQIRPSKFLRKCVDLSSPLQASVEFKVYLDVSEEFWKQLQ